MTNSELITEFINNDETITKFASNHKLSVSNFTKILKDAGFIFGRSANKNCILHLKDAISDYKNGFHSITKLAKKYKLTPKTISTELKKQNIIIINEQNKLRIDENIFSKIDSEEKAYWLGFLYADGCVQDSNNIELSLSEHDKNHLIKFNNFLKGDCNINKKIIKSGEKKFIAYRIAIKNKKMKNDLVNLGCVPRKSLILTFPNENILPKQYQIPFIRGYFDGDGCISYHCSKDKCYSRCSIIGTKDFLKECIKICNISSYYWGSEGKASCVYMNKNDSFEFIKLIYNNSLIHLDRKYNRAKLFINNNNAVYKSDLIDY